MNYLILEILPRLRPGVIVHFHDVALPYDYPRNLLQNLFASTETSLLGAFLIHNSHARILFSLSQMHYDRKAELSELFPAYRAEADGRRRVAQRLGETVPTDGRACSVVSLFPGSLMIPQKGLSWIDTR